MYLLLFVCCLACIILVKSYPQDSADHLDGFTFLQDELRLAKDPSDLVPSQDAFVVEADSSDSSDPECNSDASTNNNGDFKEEGIFRRGSFCSTTDQETAASNKPIIRPKTRASLQQKRNPCARFNKPHSSRLEHVTCGGTEVFVKTMGPDESKFVTNCIRGSETSIYQRGFFLETDVIAEYCCGIFENRGPFFVAKPCITIKPNPLTERMNLGEWKRLHPPSYDTQQ